MRLCQSCGGQISGSHSFAICPRCLLRSALDTEDDRPAQPLEAEPPRHPQPNGVGRLFVRRDFFEKYEILERVAEGGQGDVWKVWDLELRRSVAMKRLRPEAVASDPAVYRFLAEAQIASQLQHPGVLPIFDVGLDPDGRPFYTTQLLAGATLADVWRNLPNRSPAAPEMRDALELLIRVCDAVAHAHARGVIHRDLKPSNVLVGPFGDVRVIDWGSAHVLARARSDFEEPFVPLNKEIVETERSEVIWASMESPLATAQAGQPITVLFMPPEILAGHNDLLGPETDVYSLGVMLYQLCAGRPPYWDSLEQPPSAAALKERILAGPPTPLRQTCPRASPDLAAICQKAMAHSQTARYPSIIELINDLRAVLEMRPVAARHPGPALWFQKWVQRHPAYGVFAAVVLVLLFSAVSFTRELRAERNLARQQSALRSAELASRSGRWQEALKLWDQAEQAGYGDPVTLSLNRAEAWTVLTQPTRARALLERLARRPDLGGFKGAVFLRLGEHQLFDPASADRGASQVHEAIRAGLTPADLALAQGLLADSTPKALECFRRALQLNSYSHSAHRHSLGLEFLLGRHEEFQEHVRFFRMLYPDDPTPGFLEAAMLAVNGKLAEADALLETLRQACGAQAFQQLQAGFRTFAGAARAFDLEAFLATNGPPVSPLELFTAQGPMYGFTGYQNPDGPLHIPQLPCVRQGVLAGNDALRQLAIPFIGDPRAAADQVKAGWQRHPEALIPALAGLLLDQQQSKSPNLMQLETDLLQLAADSPSLLPRLPRLCRYLAARNQAALAAAASPRADVRQACLQNLQRAALADNLSATECRVYFDLAMDLDAAEVARPFLLRWEAIAGADLAVRRARIRLELGAGSYGPALQRLDQMLAENANDPWAKSQLDLTLPKIRALADSARGTSNPKP